MSLSSKTIAFLVFYIAHKAPAQRKRKIEPKFNTLKCNRESANSTQEVGARDRPQISLINVHTKVTRAQEQNEIDSFPLSTQFTLLRAQPLFLFELDCSLYPIIEGHPEKELDFQGDTAFPNFHHHQIFHSTKGHCLVE